MTSSADNPIAQLHEAMDQLRNQYDEARRRTERALAEADAALKIGSK
ncbi:MAG TPA: hypothetical protein VEP91_06075 [Solirubrobacterales bacterium]|nr:hypothetical protein [Solirubrobacterales bacterium]